MSSSKKIRIPLDSARIRSLKLASGLAEGLLLEALIDFDDADWVTLGRFFPPLFSDSALAGLAEEIDVVAGVSLLVTLGVGEFRVSSCRRSSWRGVLWKRYITLSCALNPKADYPKIFYLFAHSSLACPDVLFCVDMFLPLTQVTETSNASAIFSRPQRNVLKTQKVSHL
jgi:hypothetical protein